MQKIFLALIFIFNSFICFGQEISVQPRQGNVLPLSEGSFGFVSPRAEQLFHQVFDHLHEGMLEFEPDLGEDGEIRYFNVELNEDKNPYFVLDAALWVPVPIIKYIKIRRRVVAEVTRTESFCNDGERIVLDLAGSHLDIYLQAEFVQMDFCITEKSESGITVKYISQMVVGSDFGMRMAGHLVMKILKMQTEPLLKVFKNQFIKLKAQKEKNRGPAMESQESDCRGTSFLKKRKCVNKKGEKRAQLFLKGLSLEDQLSVLSWVKKGNSRNKKFIELQEPKENGRPVFFFIQGLFYGKAFEWYRPFYWLNKSEVGSYLYRFPPLVSTKRMAQDIEVSVKILLRAYPERNIEVVAFSAGGIPALMAWEKLQESLGEDFKRIHLTTAATPLGGYDVPKFIDKLSGIFPFMSLNHDLMTGGDGKFKKMGLSRCSHIVTTNCDLDVHACNKNPQLLEQMPCGLDNTLLSDQFSHHQALESAVEDLLQY